MKRVAKFQAGGEAEVEPPFVRRRQAREEAARAAEAEGDGRAARRERIRNYLRLGPRTQEEADILEAYRTNRDVSEIRREREAGGRAAAAPAPAPAPAAPTPAAPAPAAPSRGRQVQRPPRPAPATLAPTVDMQAGDVPGNRAPAPSGPAAAARMREIDMQGADVPGNRTMSPPARPRPAQRQAPRPRYSEADIARIRGVMEGGDIQPREPNLDERIGAFMDRNLGQIGLRRTNETGEGAASTGSLRGDLQALGRALGFKKGGMVKPMKYQEGGPVKVPGKKPAMGGPKAPASRMRDMISPSERRELDAPLTRQELDRMRESGFKKGGMIKPKGHGMKEEAMEMKGGRYRGGAKEERAEMMMKKGGAVKKYQEGGSVEEATPSRRSNRSLMERAAEGVRRNPILGPISRGARDAANALTGGAGLRRSLGKGSESLRKQMREAAPTESQDPFKLPPGRYINPNGEEEIVNIKKGGMVKAKTAKKMKSGGKVPAPKKMMKGGMTSKPKKMMGGGRALYAKGGMARGCK